MSQTKQETKPDAPAKQGEEKILGKRKSAPEDETANEQAQKKDKTNAGNEVKKPPQFLKKQERVRIKVGSGDAMKNFSTTRQTLHVFPDSKIAKMFTVGDSNELKKDDEGFYLLPDRATEGFRYCLNFLRDKDTTVPSNEEMRNSMEEEARYYGIEELIKKLTETKKAPKKPTTVFAGTKEFDGKSAATEWPKLDVSTGSPFSLSFKMSFDKKPTKAQKQWVVFHKGSAKDQQTPSLYLTADKVLNFVLNNDGDCVVSGAAMDTKTEYKIACVIDPKKKKASLFVDDKETQQDLPDNFALTEGALNIGSSEAWGKKSNFIGNMTQFTIHHTALTGPALKEVFPS